MYSRMDLEDAAGEKGHNLQVSGKAQPASLPGQNFIFGRQWKWMQGLLSLAAVCFAVGYWAALLP